MRNLLVTLTTSLFLITDCSCDVPAGSDKLSSVVTRTHDTSVSATPPISTASIRGDTFLLVAIGAQSTRVPVSDSAPCGFLPYLRVVIWDDSTFYRLTDNSLTCFGPATDSAAQSSGVWRSTYRINRDTPHLFQGDGNDAESSMKPTG